MEEKTFYVSIEADRFYHIRTIKLAGELDDVIEEGFENQEEWTDIVGDTSDLCHLDSLEGDIESGFLDYDPDSAQKLFDMIKGDEYYSEYYADAEEGFRIVILDENQEEIYAVDSCDIPYISFEDSYDYYCDKIDDSDEEEYKEYVDKNGIDPNSMCKDLGFEQEGWIWANVRYCEMHSGPTYRLQIQGDFDINKLSWKKVCVEEALNGLMYLEAATRILYDGKELELFEEAEEWRADGTNFFIKRKKDAPYPEKVYDMTNKEKQCFEVIKE